MYKIRLKNFEGPLDLLLFFIKRDELDIYDIPIGHITEEFLSYIRMLEELDLDVASEFIYMASLLMSIKARMLLPVPESDEEELLDEIDPRYELVQRLLEYKRYKEMAGKMADSEEEVRKRYVRGNTEVDTVQKQSSGESLKDVTMFDLISAFHKVLADIKRQHHYHKVARVEFTIEKQSAVVLEFLQKKGRSSFRDLVRQVSGVMEVVVTFLAVLEMLKEQQIDLYFSNEEVDPTDFSLDLKPIDEMLGEMDA